MAGIEAEYHHKNNKVSHFSWSTLNFLSQCKFCRLIFFNFLDGKLIFYDREKRTVDGKESTKCKRMRNPQKFFYMNYQLHKSKLDKIFPAQ